MRANADCIEWGGDIHVKDIKSALYAKNFVMMQGLKFVLTAVITVSAAKRQKNGSQSAKLQRLWVHHQYVWPSHVDSEKTDIDTYMTLVEDAKNICTVAADYGLCVSGMS